jgi:hypothetical protein
MNKPEQTEPEQPKIKRGDVLFSVEHDLLILELGERRALYIRPDGTLVDRDTPSPLTYGETVQVFDDSKTVLAIFFRLAKEALSQSGLPKAV